MKLTKRTIDPAAYAGNNNARHILRDNANSVFGCRITRVVENPSHNTVWQYLRGEAVKPPVLRVLRPGRPGKAVAVAARETLT